MELVEGPIRRTKVSPIEWNFGLEKLKILVIKIPTIEEQNQNF